MIYSVTLQKTRLQRLRGYGQRQLHAAQGFQRNHKSVTVAQRNRSMTGGDHLRNRARGYTACRLQKRGYGQTLTTQGFSGGVTAVTAVTAKKRNAGDARSRQDARAWKFDR
ncbi:hypothetical protein B0G81_4334 [Paraburkholderia sp. BL6665CI2N2]|nr:hypothetical protein B0G81_4334 [Paraburkholderia sp. BL6665CI2N2]